MPQLRRRALLIGTERHDDTRLDRLPCTRTDTAQLSEVLRHSAIGGFETVGIAHDLAAAGFRSAIAEFLDGDAAHLLEELDVALVEELRPAALSEGLDEADPGDGAVNVAVLFATETTPYDKGLLADLNEIRGMPDRIARTALAALLDPAGPVRNDPFVVVSPLPANAGQRAVLQAAMTRRLTVVTGPPGTGKSQLIVDVVATAVAAGQSVLVASTNNGAVNEVWRRCDKLVPGSVVRTGSGENRTHELESLQKLLGVAAPEGNAATLQAAHRVAAEQLDRCRTKSRNASCASLRRGRSYGLPPHCSASTLRGDLQRTSAGHIRLCGHRAGCSANGAATGCCAVPECPVHIPTPSRPAALWAPSPTP